MGAAEKQERLLGAPEVAERLGVSEESARRIMKRLKLVRIGLGRRQLLKIRERELAKWIESGGDDEWQRCIDEDESGGLLASTDTANDGSAPRVRHMSALPRRSRPVLRKSSLLTPIVPGTKPAR
ncbi:MAG TPA: helix-turn-helix domain-containing protein [Polyangiaceae bacterium]|nr:helix-turn-helix domain-containing protein [Polyangiaceae bacterium]